MIHRLTVPLGPRIARYTPKEIAVRMIPVSPKIYRYFTIRTRGEAVQVRGRGPWGEPRAKALRQ